MDVSDPHQPNVLNYAMPPPPPLVPAAWRYDFLGGWAAGLLLALACTCLMCGFELWQPFAVMFPHVAVVIELGLLRRGAGIFLAIFGAGPLPYGLYGIVLSRRSRVWLPVYIAIHVALLVWSLVLENPFLP